MHESKYILYGCQLIGNAHYIMYFDDLQSLYKEAKVRLQSGYSAVMKNNMTYEQLSIGLGDFD